MNISRVSLIPFGMPKISESTRARLPQTLSDKDRENLKYVENTHPDAYLDSEVIGILDLPKGRIGRSICRVTDALGLEPKYNINVHEFVSSTPDGEHIGGSSINGDTVFSDEPNRTMYIHSSRKVRHSNLTTEDLVKATNDFVKRYDKVMEDSKRRTKKH